MLISRPAQWPEHKVGFRVIGSLVGVLAFAAMSAAVGVVAAVDGDVAFLKYCLVISVLFLLVAAYGTISRRFAFNIEWRISFRQLTVDDRQRCFVTD